MIETPSFEEIFPIMLGFSPAAVRVSITPPASAGSTVKIIPIPILNVENISFASTFPHFLIYLKISGTSQEPVSISAPKPSEERLAGLDIDSRRHDQRVAQSGSQFFHIVGDIHIHLIEKYLSDQRISIAVKST